MSGPLDFNRRRFLAAAATTVAAGPLGILGLSTRTNAMTDAPKGTAIRPFQFSFSDEELADLRRRINATRWPERELVADATQGVQFATTQKLARYWGTEYDWRREIGRASCRERVSQSGGKESVKN